MGAFGTQVQIVDVADLTHVPDTPPVVQVPLKVLPAQVESLLALQVVTGAIVVVGEGLQKPDEHP